MEPPNDVMADAIELLRRYRRVVGLNSDHLGDQRNRQLIAAVTATMRTQLAEWHVGDTSDNHMASFGLQTPASSNRPLQDTLGAPGHLRDLIMIDSGGTDDVLPSSLTPSKHSSTPRQPSLRPTPSGTSHVRQSLSGHDPFGLTPPPCMTEAQLERELRMPTWPLMQFRRLETVVQPLNSFWADTAALRTEKGGRREVQWLRTLEYIECHRNKKLDLLGISGQTLDMANWNQCHHCARLLLVWLNTHIGPDGPLRAIHERKGDIDTMSSLFELYKVFRSEKAASKAYRQRDKLDEPTASPAGTTTSSPSGSSSTAAAKSGTPKRLSRTGPVEVSWQWMTAPGKNIYKRGTFSDTLSFCDAKAIVDNLFNHTGVGHEVSKFGYVQRMHGYMEAADQASWAALVEECGRDVTDWALERVVVEIYTLDLASELRPRLRIGGIKSAAAEFADSIMLPERLKVFQRHESQGTHTHSDMQMDIDAISGITELGLDGDPEV
jgi:hypothetical protein